MIFSVAISNPRDLKYISAKDFAENVLNLGEYKLLPYKLESEKFKFHFASGSFFIVFEDKENLIVTQMSLPAIQYDTQLYFPVTISESLKETGVLELIRNSGIKKLPRLVRYKSEAKEKLIKQPDTLLFRYSIDSNTTPNYYKLPKDLKLD
jgi:hypothetical protein